MFYPKFKNPSKITLKELVDKDILNEEELTMTVENMELEGTLYKHLKEPVSFTGGELLNNVPYSALKKVVCSLFESTGGYNMDDDGIAGIIERNIVNVAYESDAGACRKLGTGLFYLDSYDAACIMTVENKIGQGEDVIISKQDVTDTFTYSEQANTTVLMRAHNETAITIREAEGARFYVNGPEALVLSFGPYATIMADTYTDVEEAGTIISTGCEAYVSAMRGVNNFCIRGANSKFKSFVKETPLFACVPAKLEVTGMESEIQMDFPYQYLKVGSDTHVMLGDEVLDLPPNAWLYFNEDTSSYREVVNI